MRRVVDFSDYQAGADLATVARACDACWAKAGDWSYISSRGWPGDDLHGPAFDVFPQVGTPLGSYLFVRPGWTSPATQISQWRAHVPDSFTLAPMIDLETPGSLSGGSLTDWVDEALALTAQYFGVTPVLYWSRAFQQGHGMGMPRTPHIPMVAEYHRGYSPFNWADLSGWEQRAYSAYGGPDVPVGYNLAPRDLIWQFTSSAQVPGFGGLVDCSFVPDEAWAAITGGGSFGPAAVITPASEEDELNSTEKDQLANVDGRTAYLQQLTQAIYNWANGANSQGEAANARLDQMKQQVAAIEGVVQKGYAALSAQVQSMPTSSGPMVPVLPPQKVVDVEASLRQATTEQLAALGPVKLVTALTVAFQGDADDSVDAPPNIG